MERTQLFGLLIVAGTALEMILFLWGIVRRSYMAVALPVLGAMTALNLLTLWVGWTMLTTEAEMPEEEGLELELESEGTEA
ncbi:MAG: hypothetical protein MUP86_03245 [Dehalococcoidia bacterium]|jgi:hypothetical protein|nr:hypothetical protein [Dehalococcoidia bacterium]